MARTKTDRRRKRKSPSSEEESRPSQQAPSWAVIPLVLLAGFALSIAISYCSDEAQQFDDNDHVPNQQEQRRFLLNEDERIFDVGIKENIWRSQLRVRKEHQREQQDTHTNRRQMKVMDSEMEDGRPMKRMAIIPRYVDKHHFEECVGETINRCQELIDAYVTAHPDMFNNQTSLMMDIRKIREVTDASYYKVVIRTNLEGTQSYGIFDDGVIYYPWPWTVGGADQSIGPWDCEMNGVYMTPAECCAMIQDDVGIADDKGEYLACFVEEPVGGPTNPERDDRAIVVTNRGGTVVRPPVAH